MSYSKTKVIRISKVDTECSKRVRERDGKCLVCGRTENLAAHHVIGRATKATRFILENLVTLCVSHHVFNNDFSAHRTPKDFREWFVKKYPARWRIIQERLKTKMTEREAIIEFIEKYGNKEVI